MKAQSIVNTNGNRPWRKHRTDPGTKSIWFFAMENLLFTKYSFVRSNWLKYFSSYDFIDVINYLLIICFPYLLCTGSKISSSCTTGLLPQWKPHQHPQRHVRKSCWLHQETTRFPSQVNISSFQNREEKENALEFSKTWTLNNYSEVFKQKYLHVFMLPLINSIIYWLDFLLVTVPYLLSDLYW